MSRIWCRRGFRTELAALTADGRRSALAALDLGAMRRWTESIR
jgi:hypothetical protein